MPARGLILREVDYPEDSELAERAVLTRVKRTLPGGDAQGEDDE